MKQLKAGPGHNLASDFLKTLEEFLLYHIGTEQTRLQKTV